MTSPPQRFPVSDSLSPTGSQAAPALDSGRGPREDLPRVVLALAIGGLGGWLATWAGLPLPWMIGSMLGTTLAALIGLPVAMRMSFRAFMVVVLGVMLGSSFRPELLDQLAQWSASLALLLAFIAVAGGASLLFFRWTARYDPTTAYFAAMPGGLSEMVVIGGAMGGDSRIISLTHSARLLIVVLILPFAFQLFTGYSPEQRPAPGPGLFDTDPWDLAVLAGCGLAGYLLAQALRIPAAVITGPMLLSAALHLGGVTEAAPPLELVAAAQVVVGSAIGARFAGTRIRFVLRALLVALGSTAVLLAVTVAFAWCLSVWTGLPLPGLILAYAPGGVAEMSLIALALSLDAAFVATHHILRIFLIVVLAPLVFRFSTRAPVVGRKADPDP